MLVCKECSSPLTIRNRTGLCRKHYDREKKRQLYSLRKKQGFSTGAKVGSRAIYGLKSNEVPHKGETLTPILSFFDTLPPAGEVRCYDCRKSFVTEVSFLDSVCPWCGGHKLVKAV